MSLLFFDGFQDATLMPKPEWGVNYPNAGAAGLGRDGSAAGAARASNTTVMVTLPTAATTCFVGLARMATSRIDSGVVSFVRAGVTELVVTVNAAGMIELRRTSVTGTLLATSSGHPSLAGNNLWHHFQVKAVLRSDGAGSAEVRLDGATTPVINYTGQTSGTTGDVTQVGLHGPANGSGDLYYDDMWVCDAVDATATQGAANNTFLGDMKIVSLYPTAAGTTTQFTPSVGANWSCVDEVPVNTTDYVASPTVGNRDLYGLGDLPAGAGNPKAIRVGVYAQKTDAGASSLKPAVRESGGLVTAQAAQALTTSWAGYFGASLFRRPSDNAAWSVADVNGLQAGVEVA